MSSVQVNFIRSHGINYRRFKVLLDDTESEHGDTVYG